MAWVLKGLYGGFITGQVGLERALGRLPKQSPVLFQIPLRCVFGQPGREKSFADCAKTKHTRPGVH